MICYMREPYLFHFWESYYHFMTRHNFKLFDYAYSTTHAGSSIEQVTSGYRTQYLPPNYIPSRVETSFHTMFLIGTLLNFLPDFLFVKKLIIIINLNQSFIHRVPISTVFVKNSKYSEIYGIADGSREWFENPIFDKYLLLNCRYYFFSGGNAGSLPTLQLMFLKCYFMSPHLLIIPVV